MKHIDLVNTILHIRPNAEFAVRGEEIEWLDKKQKEPTQAEIEAGHIAYLAKVEQDAADAKAQRAALLARLGITEAEAKILLS